MKLPAAHHQDNPSSNSKEQPGRETVHSGHRKADIRDQAKYVLRHFNSIAGKYDFMNTILSFGLHHLWKRRSVDMMALKPGSLVIDVCGGTADLSILAAKTIGPKGHVILYDINRAMIDGGKPKVRKAALERHICYVEGDAEYLSFPDGCFDAAMIGFGIRNVTHMGKAIEEIYRVLKQGGKLMCLEFSLPTSYWFRFLYDFYSFHIMPLAGKILAGTSEAYFYLPESIRKFPPPDQFAAILQDAGFSTVTCRNLTKGIAVIYTGVKD